MALRAKTLHTQFVAFASFGDINANGERIKLPNVDMWLKQAKILDELNLSHTDTGLCFMKMKKSSLTYHEFVKFLDDLASYKSVDVGEIKIKLRECGLPGDDEKKEKSSGNLEKH
ncbi:hypothetical protein FQR65_LT07675 [Abscondita terminalis]|nr:hypothetical protein FQR65_LT07675 [Abscondita terminalis]